MTMTQLRPALALASILFLAACSGTSWGPAHFVSAREVPPTAIEAPPPVDSPAYNVGLRQVIVEQASLGNADKAAIRAEDRIDPSMMLKPTLGHTYTAECYPGALHAAQQRQGRRAAYQQQRRGPLGRQAPMDQQERACLRAGHRPSRLPERPRDHQLCLGGYPEHALPAPGGRLLRARRRHRPPPRRGGGAFPLRT
ncbi:MAG: hypothetical protein WDN72_07750 [Alphaproteobacteria bacterium]